MKRVSVVIPVYNEAESLPRLFDELASVEAQLAGRGCALELIFVDDGSGDGSLDLLHGFRERNRAAKIVRLARNFGAVPASKAGLRYVTGDCFLWLSADLQDPPTLVAPMVDHWQAGAKYVLAERAARRDPVGTRLFAGAYYRLVRLLVVRSYPRGGFDVILLDKSLIPYLRDSGKSVNPSLLSYWLGVKPVVVPYERPPRLHGNSGWTFGKKLRYAADSLLGFSPLPLRLVALVGIIVALVGFAYAISAAQDTTGVPILLGAICLLLGLVIVMLAIIGEYVWRIYDEASHRPEVVVEETYL